MLSLGLTAIDRIGRQPPRVSSNGGRNDLKAPSDRWRDGHNLRLRRVLLANLHREPSVGRGASSIEASSHDILPKAGFAAMLGFKGCNISLMRLKRAEIANRRRQAFAFGKVAGRMAVGAATRLPA